jgi:hypothetical protein
MCDINLKYIWKRLYTRDVQTAEKYSKSGDFKLPKEIWELILLNKRQQQLCTNLSLDKNKDLLILFAQELNIPVNKNITKGQLCSTIARQLSYGKYYSDQSKVYTDRKINEDKRKIKDVGRRLGLNVDRPIHEILKDLSHLF